MPKNLIYPKPKPKLPYYMNGDFKDFLAPEVAAPNVTVPFKSNVAGQLPEVTVSTNSSYKGAQPIDRAKIPITDYSKIINSKGILPATTTGVTSNTNNLLDGLKQTVPYMSNVANMFSKPDMPSAPSYMDKVSFKRANFDQQRAAAENSARGVDLSADRNLDGNNAMISKLATYTQKAKALSEITNNEQQTNNQIANQEQQLNSGIESRNLGVKDQYNRDVVDRSNVIKSNRSANFADMSNKFIAKQNENSKMALDKDKMKILSRMAPDVWKRLMAKLQAEGVNTGN